MDRAYRVTMMNKSENEDESEKYERCLSTTYHVADIVGRQARDNEWETHV